MSVGVQLLIGAAFLIGCWALVGSTYDRVEVNGRVLPRTPRWWVPRGAVLFLAFTALIIVLPVALLHDLLFPRRRRWIRYDTGKKPNPEPGKQPPGGEGDRG